MTVLFCTVPQHLREQTLTKYLLSQWPDQHCPCTRQHVHLQVLFALTLYLFPSSHQIRSCLSPP